MTHLTGHRGPQKPVSLALAALLASVVLETTCQVNMPNLSLNVDEQELRLQAPGLTIHIEPGLIDINSSTWQANLE
ncbi:MAG TPA: hypothetical protein VLM89_08550 [Phycisphaerae bacterium]|nr:hypothetical protein [Phycisphaerae bacterium]